MRCTMQRHDRNDEERIALPQGRKCLRQLRAVGARAGRLLEEDLAAGRAIEPAIGAQSALPRTSRGLRDTTV